VKGEHTRYQLVVRGELDERYGYLFDGMEMERTGGTTAFTGSIPDQAKLHGLIVEKNEHTGKDGAPLPAPTLTITPELVKSIVQQVRDDF